MKLDDIAFWILIILILILVIEMVLKVSGWI